MPDIIAQFDGWRSRGFEASLADWILAQMPIGFWPEKRKSRATVKVAESGFALPRTSPIHDLIENGGEEEIRTLDPHVANVMLYQLSYFPIRENGAYYTIMDFLSARGYFSCFIIADFRFKIAIFVLLCLLVVSPCRVPCCVSLSCSLWCFRVASVVSVGLLGRFARLLCEVVLIQSPWRRQSRIVRPNALRNRFLAARGLA